MSDKQAPTHRLAPNLTRLAFFYLVPTYLSLLVVACVFAFYFKAFWPSAALFASAFLAFGLSRWVVKLAGAIGLAYRDSGGLVSQEAGVVMKVITRLCFVLVIPSAALPLYYGIRWYLAVPLGLVIGFVLAACVGMTFSFLSWDDRESIVQPPA